MMQVARTEYSVQYVRIQCINYYGNLGAVVRTDPVVATATAESSSLFRSSRRAAA